MPKYNWTSEKIEQLKKLYPHKTGDELASIFNCSRDQVYSAARRNKLTMPITWNKANIDKLKKLYPIHPAKEVARMMSTTLSAVRNAAILYKVKKTKRYWSPDEMNYIVENYNKVPISTLMEKFPSRTKWAIINKYRQLTTNKKAAT